MSGPISYFMSGLGTRILNEEQRLEIKKYANDRMGDNYHDVMAGVVGMTLRFALENAGITKEKSKKYKYLGET